MAKLSDIVKEKLEKVNIKPAKCRACGEEIIFISTSRGKLMPLGLDLTPHWTTCTNPQQFRKKDEEKKQDKASSSSEPEPDMDDLPI